MSEFEFQKKVLEELGSISSKQSIFYDEQRIQQADIKELKEKVTQALESTKAAHHRINTILKIIGGMTTAIITLIIAYITK